MVTTVEKIQSTEHKIGEMQEALSAIQSGLERAEDVAVVAEDARRRSELILRSTVILGAIALIRLIYSRKKDS